MTTVIKRQESSVYLDMDLKQKAKELFKNYGLTLSDGLNLLLEQAINRKNPILISDLDIEPVSPNDPDYKLMKEARKGDTISLDEFMKL